MITIEEKIKLFTKIVYDRVERENKLTIGKFNEEFSNLLEDKKREFILEADEMYKKSKREIEKECTQVISRARVESKKLILSREKSLIDECIKMLFEYAVNFTKSNEYEEYFKELLLSIKDEIEITDEIIIYLTADDYGKFRNMVEAIFKEIKYKIEVDNDLIGGIAIIDINKHLRIDMSLKTKIIESRDLIGQRIADMFS